jgi:ubiquinol-cytochrome c reductase cytochrome c1 subunit
MKKLFAGLTAALCMALSFLLPAHAQEGGAPWDTFPKDRLNSKPALQHGAKLFVNYCLSCHAASYMRYNRMNDIGLTDDDIKKNLLFAGTKVGDTMTVAMDPKDAKIWFGAVPPDLSVITRSREGPRGSGADYVYTYLRSFYRDPNRPTGWNNTAYPNVAMPNVLWELQGLQGAVFKEEKAADEGGKSVEVFQNFHLLSPGKLTPAEYDSSVADIVAYLQWMSEPTANQRKRLGIWVLLFLAVLTVSAWQLNRAYWKDIK